jgi:hypothetical protein
MNSLFEVLIKSRSSLSFVVEYFISTWRSCNHSACYMLSGKRSNLLPGGFRDCESHSIKSFRQWNCVPFKLRSQGICEWLSIVNLSNIIPYSDTLLVHLVILCGVCKQPIQWLNLGRFKIIHWTSNQASNLWNNLSNTICIS